MKGPAQEVVQEEVVQEVKVDSDAKDDKEQAEADVEAEEVEGARDANSVAVRLVAIVRTEVLRP